MPKYEPITALTTDWDKFMHAFFTLFYCHAMLWSVGIRHGDISQSNLIWDPMTRKPKLCDFDFDLSHSPPEVGVAEVGPNGPVGFSDTRTWIFMADDLLTEEAMAGHVERVYRHEVEAFVAVLVWVAYRYVDGKLRHNPPFENWIHRDYRHVSAERMYTLGKIERGRFLKPSDFPDDLLAIIRLTISAMNAHQRRVGTLEIETDAAARRRKRFPDASAPVELLEDYNDLRALPTKILTWDIFTQLPSATRFIHLLNERFLNASNEGQERKI